MTLATKNGSLIVKDGKLAENCNCCGDWYCCPQFVLCPDRLRVSAEVLAADQSGTYTLTDARCGAYYWFPNMVGAAISKTAVNILNASALSGSYDLPKTLTDGSVSIFEKSFASDGAGCSGAKISVAVFGTGGCSISVWCNDYHWQSQISGSVPPSPKTLSEMKCGTEGSSLNNCEPQELYYKRVQLFAQLNMPIDLSCLSPSFVTTASISAGVREIFYEINSGDGIQVYGVRGGTFAQSYSVRVPVTVKLTFSVD